MRVKDTSASVKEKNTTYDELKEQLTAIQKTLQRIDERGEKLESAILELQLENDSLKKQVQDLKKEKEEQKEEVRRTNVVLRQTRIQVNQFEQWSRKWNVRIWGLKDDENESLQECALKVVSFFRNEMGMTNFPEEGIDIAHRIGPFRHDENRQVMVRFSRMAERNAVLQAKSRLRGKPMSIAEDLTVSNYKLLNAVKSKAGKQNAWTRDGTVFARLQSGRVVRIDQITNLSDYFDDTTRREEYKGWQSRQKESREHLKGVRERQEHLKDPDGSDSLRSLPGTKRTSKAVIQGTRMHSGDDSLREQSASRSLGTSAPMKEDPRSGPRVDSMRDLSASQVGRIPQRSQRR